MENQVFYNSGNYEKYNTKNPLKRILVKRLNEKILLEAKKMRDEGCRSVLDAGCGEGFVSKLIKSKIPEIQITGIEYTSEALQIAKADCAEINFLQGNICNLPFADDSFDFVLCTEVLEHLENPEKALLELMRVSKKGMILTVPNEPWFCLGNLLALKNVKRFGNPIDHKNHWTANGFLKFVNNIVDGGGGYYILLFRGRWWCCGSDAVCRIALAKRMAI